MTAGESRKPSRRDADAALLAALAGGATRADAAKAAGVSEATVYRRLGESEFRTALDARRAEIVEQATARLLDASTEAINTLRALLDDESSNVRLGAARALLDQAQRWRSAEDTELRIAELEERLDEHDRRETARLTAVPAS